MNQLHKNKTDKLQQIVKELFANKSAFKVYHGSTNSTRVQEFDRNATVDVSDLNEVIKVDTDKKFVVCEPNVPMDRLFKATIKHGLIPPVIPEFPGITVGGAIQGSAIESTSHNYGCFSQTTNWIEMILANGELVEVSPEKNSDLYYGAAGSYGTLGIVTAAEVKLVPAKKYVELSFIPISSFKEGLKVTKQKVEKELCHFIECGMFSEKHGVVIVGRMVDSKNHKLVKFSRPFDEWYYIHAEKIAMQQEAMVQTTPLKDYVFRYNRGAFWGGKMAFDHFDVPFNRFTRLAFDPIMRTRKLYQALQASGVAQEYICQDIVLPESSLLKFLDFTREEFGIHITGFVPIKAEPKSPFQCNGIDTKEMLYNVGVYGLRIRCYDKFVDANKKIETETKRLNGKKWFYAYSYYSEKDFWSIYNKDWYDKLRKKYHATTLPSIYDKIIVKKKYNYDHKKAAIKTILNRAELRIKD